MGELTSANTTPYAITLSKTFSFDPLISGGYLSNNPSSSWSDERRDSAFASTISYLVWAVAKRQTVGIVENCKSRDPLCFPTANSSAISQSDMSGPFTDHN
jgi:hypothetical protein